MLARKSRGGQVYFMLWLGRTLIHQSGYFLVMAKIGVSEPHIKIVRLKKKSKMTSYAPMLPCKNDCQKVTIMSNTNKKTNKQHSQTYFYKCNHFEKRQLSWHTHIHAPMLPCKNACQEVTAISATNVVIIIYVSVSAVFWGFLAMFLPHGPIQCMLWNFSVLNWT